MIAEIDIHIGNWYHHNENWCHRENKDAFDFQWEFNDWYALGECTMSLSDVIPIPLTDEWVTKLGFFEGLIEGTPGVFENGKYDIERLFVNSTEWEFCIHGHQTGTVIKYVHELQDLVRALSVTYTI